MEMALEVWAAMNFVRLLRSWWAPLIPAGQSPDLSLPLRLHLYWNLSSVHCQWATSLSHRPDALWCLSSCNLTCRVATEPQMSMIHSYTLQDFKPPIYMSDSDFVNLTMNKCVLFLHLLWQLSSSLHTQFFDNQTHWFPSLLAWLSIFAAGRFVIPREILARWNSNVWCDRIWLSTCRFW